ncbi:MAG TPA: hypothetical protein VGF45_16210, partial [Polyangia bacterium]
MCLFRRAPWFKVWRVSPALGRRPVGVDRCAGISFPRSPLVAAAAVLAAAFVTKSAAAAPRTAACEESGDARIWWSPEVPVAGQPLRILAVAPAARSPRLHAGRAGKLAALPTTKRLGPPPSFAAALERPSAGEQRVELRQGDRVLACRT